MKHILTFEEFLNESSINEGSYTDLENFMKDLVDACKKHNKFELNGSQGILLDTVGGFGFRKETLVVSTSKLGSELKEDEKFAKDLVAKVFASHKSKINKSYTRDGSYAFTYKK
jgi:hypothetical protein